jgi:hypothetical protein
MWAQPARRLNRRPLGCKRKMDILHLRLFNEKVDRLDRCHLAKRMENHEYHFKTEKLINKEWISADGVSEDDIDAFVLNLRLLIQPRDGISFHQIFTKYYSQNEESKLLRIRFKEEIIHWKEHEEIISIFGRLDGKGNYSNKELFDILFYGGLAHMNTKYVRSFYSLTKQGVVSSMIFHSFLSNLNFKLNILRSMRQINNELLAQLIAPKDNKL